MSDNAQHSQGDGTKDEGKRDPDSSLPSPLSPLPSSSPPPRRGRKRILLLIVTLLAGVGGLIYWLDARQYEMTDDAFIDGHIIMVAPQVSGLVKAVHVDDNQPVKKGDVLLEIDPRDFEARLAQAQGALAAAQARKEAADVNVDLVKITSTAEFDTASAGQDMAKTAAVAARTQVDAAKSRLKQAQAQEATAAATLEQYRADIAAAGAEADRAAADLRRYEQLFKAGSATGQQHDNAIAANTAAAAKLESARKKIATAEAQIQEAKAAIGTAEEGIKQAQDGVAQADAAVTEAKARVAQASVTEQRQKTSQSQQQGAAADIKQLQANVDFARLQLSYTKIVAAEDGRVTKKSVEPGAYVQVGQTLLAMVPGNVWVTANYKETQLTLMKQGQGVTVEVDAYPGRQFKAHLDSIQKGSGARFSLLPPENATGNYVKVVQRVPVKIVFDDPADIVNYHLGPGMSVAPKVRVR